IPIETGKTLDELLTSGEIPAATGLKIEAPDVKPLIPNPRDVAVDAMRRTGYYPINHTVVVRNDILEANPGRADDVYDTFVAAQHEYLDRVKRGQIENPDPVHMRAMEIIGDPLPYGIEPNREMLETLIGYAMEQGI